MIRIRKPDFYFLVLYANKEQNILRLQKDTRVVLFEIQASIKKRTNEKIKIKGCFPDPAVAAKSRSRVRMCTVVLVPYVLHVLTEDSSVPGECRVEGVEVNTLHLLFVLLADLKQGIFY